MDQTYLVEFYDKDDAHPSKVIEQRKMTANATIKFMSEMLEMERTVAKNKVLLKDYKVPSAKFAVSQIECIADNS